MRQGLALKDIEEGARELSGVKSGSQIGFTQVSATRAIDQVSAGPKLREQLCRQYAVRGFGEWKQTDECVDMRQHGHKPLLADISPDAIR